MCEQVVTQKPKVRRRREGQGEEGARRRAQDRGRAARGGGEDRDSAVGGERGQREAFASSWRRSRSEVKGQPDAEGARPHCSQRRRPLARVRGGAEGVPGGGEASAPRATRSTKFDPDLVAARRECDAQRDPLVSARARAARASRADARRRLGRACRVGRGRDPSTGAERRETEAARSTRSALDGVCSTSCATPRRSTPPTRRYRRCGSRRRCGDRARRPSEAHRGRHEGAPRSLKRVDERT